MRKRLLLALVTVSLVAGCARLGLLGAPGGSPGVVETSTAPTDEQSYDPYPSPILVMTGTTDDHYSIWEPLVEVRPAVNESDPVVAVRSDVGIMMGIEGGFMFAKAKSGQDLVFDAIVKDGKFQIPPGDYQVTVYFRSCDANCGFLDPAQVICSVQGSLEEGARYRITVTEYDQTARGPGSCEFDAR